MALFGHQNDAGDAGLAACAKGRSPGLGDVVLLIGHIRGREADAFIKLNREHLWNRPVRNESQGTDYDFDDERPEPWRGKMLKGISLDGPILCHSYLKPPKRSVGWGHGAETNTSMEKGDRPRDFMYPHNAVSGISSSMFLTDLWPGPDRMPTPRVTSYTREVPMRFEKGSSTFRRWNGQSVTLDKPTKIYLIDNDPDCLNFWAWTPTLDQADQKVFMEHANDFYARRNRFDEEDFPSIKSAGGSTRAPSRAGFETRIGLSGTEYQLDGPKITQGGFRDVYPVKIIGQLRCALIMAEQTAIQKRVAEMLEKEPEELRANPPELELVTKMIRLGGDDSQSEREHSEMLEDEAKFVQNHQHIHINQILDIAYKHGSETWLIEVRQKYCLNDEVLPLPINKLDTARQLICGLKHCHDHAFMNRDVKPANVLLQLLEFGTKDCDLYRWVIKFTDWGTVASTDHQVRGRVGSPWYCAPEVLDGKIYNAKADVFSLGVLLLCMFANYNPNRKRSGWHPCSSSEVELWMREEVDQVIEENCPPIFWVLLRGMLLRDPKARWSLDKCWAFVLEVDESQSSSECPSIALSLPWTTHPFLEQRHNDGGGNKIEMFQRDGMVKAEDGLSDDVSDDEKTVTPAALGTLTDHSGANVDESQVTNQKDDAPSTPNFSCAVQLPVTPSLGAMEEDGLPSAFCTPDFHHKMPTLDVRQAADQVEFYDFSACWDWGPRLCYRRLPERRAATKAFTKPSPRRGPAPPLGITHWNSGFDMIPKTSRQTKAQQYSPSQQLSKNLVSAIQSAGAHAAQIEPPNNDEDTEAETEVDDENRPAQPAADADADGGNESEAETEIEFEGGEPEAPFSSPGEVQATSRTDIDCENERREAPDDLKPIDLIPLAQTPPPVQDRKRRPLGTTQPNNNKKRKYNVYKPVDMGRGRMGALYR
ncbi:hypothetical protein AYO20_08420 [Fonsecaea nubica]|uniref:non-specific serine/threonine protein kinase n=1 Tax=Fonsecaea nubica TaxID=856822 RepID=A0A178CMQ1_9EURO|nr:hypothetical protein AYO20_08420 [Fonsecaea nubica]OAL31089.1 hypothetical protein AYO20_08420 [Fonsecaea nubica]